MLANLLNRAVTIRPRSGAPFTVQGALQQVRRDELREHGHFSVTEWRLFLPAGTALSTADRVEVDGQRFEVAGDPWTVHDELTGAPHHVEATLEVTASSGGSSEEDW